MEEVVDGPEATLVLPTSPLVLIPSATMADFDTNAAAGPSNVEEPLWTTPDVAEERTDNAGRDELYAVLNLPRDCSPEDIQRSYKRLASTFDYSIDRPWQLTTTSDSAVTS